MESGTDLGIENIVGAEVIGRGGFSTVYAATDTQFDRRVAVKVLGKLIKESDRGRFERECKVMGRLSSHPGVVTLYNAGYTNDDEPYILMQLSEDGTLADMAKARNGLPWADACRYMIPIAGALHRAHEEGILHRDVKPENILIDNGVAQLTDFGIAHLRDSSGSTSTNIAASWMHTAPETFENRRDERSDVYSAASTLYSLIAARAPFEDPTDESINPMMRRLLDENPPALGAGLVPAGLDQFLQTCLAKDPMARPQTAGIFADGLQLLVDSKGAQTPQIATGPSTAHTGGSRQTVQVLPPVTNPGPQGEPTTWAPPDQPTPAPSTQPRLPPGLGQPAPSSLADPRSAQPPATSRGPRLAILGVLIAIVVALGGLGATVFALRGSSEPGGVDNGDDITSGETPAVTLSEDADEGSEPAIEEPEEASDPTVEEPSDGPGISPPPESVAAIQFDGPVGSLEELEERWAQSRAAVVTTLSSDAYGIDQNNVLHGPGGFQVDLSQCPPGWSETEGVDDSTIRIGHTTAQTGSLGVYGNLATGMELYFNYVNENGGIQGRNIELIVKDDEYDPNQTAQAVDELRSEGMFAITTLGTPNSFEVVDTLNEACIPQPFVLSAHPAWADPANRPFTTGLQMSYEVEARLWGEWIESNFADQLPIRVSAAVVDSEFGVGYQSAFETWMTENPDVVSEFSAVAHNPAAQDVSSDVTTLLSNEPDVFISMTAGSQCLVVLEEAAGQGFQANDSAYIHPSVCRAPSLVSPAGQGADGIIVLSGGQKAAYDTRFDDDPFVAFVREQMAASGLDQDSAPLAASGFGTYAWSQVETLRIASELPGGLTRSNLLLATRGMDLVHPMLADGVQFRVWGLDDAHFVESSEVNVYDSAQQAWVLDSPIISVEGTAPSCSWKPAIGC